MGMDTIGAAATFLSDWNDAMATAKKDVQSRSRSLHDKAMETFADAMRDCDKAIEGIMEKHQENVAKSAEKLKEHRKKVAAEERREKAAEEQRLFYEEALISAINQRNVLMEDLVNDIERREKFATLG